MVRLNLLPGITVRKQLDNVVHCVETYLNKLSVRTSFLPMEIVLQNEIEALQQRLVTMAEKFATELPISAEEPRDVDWIAEQERIDALRLKFLQYAQNVVKQDDDTQSEHIENIDNFLTFLGQTMLEIDDALHPIDSPEMYADYSKRELMQYEKFHWSKRQRQLRNKMATHIVHAHAEEYYKENMEDAVSLLKSVWPTCINTEKNYIYHEALGKCIWEFGHDANSDFSINEVMGIVKTVAYFGTKANIDTVFLDSEPTEEEAGTEAVQTLTLIETIRQNQLPSAIYFTNRCAAHFTEEYDEKWIRDMWTAAIDDETISPILCKRLKGKGKNKAVCQMVGELQMRGVIDSDQCKNEELYTSLGLSRPDKSAIIDYIRKGFNDCQELHDWVANYTPASEENPNG